jgi:hypothetical protein
MNNPTDIVSYTPVLYSAGAATASTLMSDAAVVSNALSGDFRSGIIQTLLVIDKDSQGAAFDLWTLDTVVSLGTLNSAPNITAANAVNLMSRISVGTGDYVTFTNFKAAFITGLAVPVHAIDTTRDIAVALINGAGTPTHTASGLVLRFGILRDQHTN